MVENKEKALNKENEEVLFTAPFSLLQNNSQFAP
jgi:hypothetical protein